MESMVLGDGSEENIDDLLAEAERVFSMNKTQPLPYSATLNHPFPVVAAEVPLMLSPSQTSEHHHMKIQSNKPKRITWTEVEHRRFLEGLVKYGKGDWKNISAYIGTKNSTQVASHAQKYYLRQSKSKEQKKRKSIHDMVHLPFSQSYEMQLLQGPESIPFNPHINMQPPQVQQRRINFNPHINMQMPPPPHLNRQPPPEMMMQPNHMNNINHHPQQMNYYQYLLQNLTDTSNN